jgi:hypothetical protein
MAQKKNKSGLKEKAVLMKLATGMAPAYKSMAMPHGNKDVVFSHNRRGVTKSSHVVRSTVLPHHAAINTTPERPTSIKS